MPLRQRLTSVATDVAAKTASIPARSHRPIHDLDIRSCIHG
jgi:hypothetical protein